MNLYTYNEMHRSQVYNLINFGKYVQQYNWHPSQDTEHLYRSRKFPIIPFQYIHGSP